MKADRVFRLFFVLVLGAAPPLLQADDAPEIGPGVASHVQQEDAPLDHAAVSQAVKDGIRMSGAGDPLKNTEPYKDQWFQSGKDPYDAFYYKASPDGKLYGKGQKAPKGSRNVRIKVQHYRGVWVAHVEMYHREGDDMITDGLASSGVHESDQLESDKNSGSAREERGAKFDAHDPRTAVLQAIARMQRKGALYDPVKEIVPDPQAPAPGTQDSSPAPQRQAHPVHGSRQAHPVHGSQTAPASFGDDYKMGGGENAALGAEVGFDGRPAAECAKDHS